MKRIALFLSLAILAGPLMARVLPVRFYTGTAAELSALTCNAGREGWWFKVTNDSATGACSGSGSATSLCECHSSLWADAFASVVGGGSPTGAAGGDLTGTYPNPTVAANSVALGTDTTGNYAASSSEGGPATSVAADSVALGTDTTGNYAGSASEGGPATTALALNANPAACGANLFGTDTDAAGALTCTQPAFSNLSGAATDAQIPNTITIDLATLATTATTANAGDSATAFFPSGTIEPALLGSGSGGSTKFLREDSTWQTVSAGGDSIRVEDGNDAGTFTSMVDADFDDSGDINFVRAAGPPDVITATVRADSVALGTDTTGNYAGSSSEGGAATTATALAADGGNCSAGNYPLGVDAAGAVQSCTADDDVPESGDFGALALTGDVTSSGLTTTLANIPTATPLAGYLLTTSIVAPSTPAAGKTSIYVDSTDKRLHDKNDAGAIGTTVVADTGAANNFLTAISVAGAVSKARPTCGNLSDSAGGCTMSTTAGGDLAGTLPSPTVTGTHLSAALPINQGGTGTTSTLTGIVRGNASAMTAAELSGDVTTSASNATTIAANAVTDAKAADDLTIASTHDLATSGKVQVGSLTAGSASCVSRESSTDRLFSDLDCDGVVDSGEGYLDGNTVEVSIALTADGSVFSTTVTGQTWVQAATKVACSPFGTSADGQTVETYYAAQFAVTASTIVAGTGFSVGVYSPNGASGTFRFYCYESGGGGSIVAPAYISPDTPPAAPATADDDFDFGSGIDTSSARRTGSVAWSWVNQGSATAALAGGQLVLTAPVSASNSLRLVCQATSGSTWKYRARLASLDSGSSNFYSVGMAARNSSSGKLLVWEKLYSTGFKVAWERWTDANTSSAVAGASAATDVFTSTTLFSRSWRAPFYIEMEQTATNVIVRYGDVGVDGTFITFNSAETLAGFIGSVDQICLFANSSNSVATWGAWDWFRKIS